MKIFHRRKRVGWEETLAREGQRKLEEETDHLGRLSLVSLVWELPSKPQLLSLSLVVPLEIEALIF